MSRKRFSLSLSNFLPLNKTKNHDGKQRKSLLDSLFSSLHSVRPKTYLKCHQVTTQDMHESVIFIWFDREELISMNIINSLRSINDTIRVFNDMNACLSTIETSNEKIFFITSFNDNEFLDKIHEYPAVELVFLLAESQIERTLPKLYGVYTQLETLFCELKEALSIFEQVRLEMFYSEEDPTFLWRQIWKEAIKRKIPSNQQDFLATVRIYYENNVEVNTIIDHFEKSYRSTDVFNWCFHSPFPSRFIRHALCFQNKQQIELCRFLFLDAIQSMQQKQSESKFCLQVYRGMKISQEHIEHFEEHIDKLICSSGFFPCTKSKSNAIALATLTTYRSDLTPVLFQIDCEANDRFIEISTQSTTIIFDICLAFRVTQVERQTITIIKLKTSGKDGQQIAREYLEHYKDQTIESLLLNEPKRRRSSNVVFVNENDAKKYIDQDEIDLALLVYQRIQPVTPKILNLIGQLVADKKGDYEYAFQCFSRALKMQEETEDDPSETLTHLGNIYCHRQDVNMALNCHQRALAVREIANPTDFNSIATSLIGLANAYYLRREYREAIVHAGRALSIQQTIASCHENDLIKTFMLLGKIYYQWNKYKQALDRYTQALTLAKHSSPIDLHVQAELFNCIGNIHRDLNQIDLAKTNLEKAICIYANILPRDHPIRTAAQMDLTNSQKDLITFDNYDQ